MIVDIIPLRRMARHLGKFSYRCPEDLQKKIAIGQIVQIPFRKSKILGLVFECKKQSASKQLKPLIKIVNPAQLLTKDYLELIELLSSIYGISLSVAARMFLSPPKITKLTKSKFKKIKTTQPKQQPPKYTFFKTYADEVSYISKLAKKSLILVPEKHLINNILKQLNSDKVVVWTSDLTEKQKYEIWEKVRNNDYDYVIGTRSACFLPFYTLKAVHIYYEHEENHKNFDGAPLFSVHDIAYKISRLHGAKIILSSYSPSFSSYKKIHKNEIGFNKTKLTLPIYNNTRIINMADVRRGGNYNIISDQVLDKINSCSSDVFLYINRLGTARSVGCRECHHSYTCHKCLLPLIYHEGLKQLHCHYCKVAMPLQMNCPECSSTLVKFSGVGTESAAKEISKNVLNKKIVRIDREATRVTLPNESCIIVGTRKALPYLRYKRTDLIVLVNPDIELQFPEYLAQEKLWHLLRTFQYNLSSESQILLQTFNPYHLCIRSLSEPDRLYRTDLNTRRSLLYPPYSFLVKYICSGREHNESIRAANEQIKIFHSNLTKEQKNTIIIGPISPQVSFYRKQYLQIILVKIIGNEPLLTLAKLNKNILPTTKVDPSPINLLAP